MTRRTKTATLLIAASLYSYSATAVQSSEAIISSTSEHLTVADIAVGSDSVSGTLVNHSAATLRSIQLALWQKFLWKDEMHPGDDSPGRMLAFSVGPDLGPQARARFSFPFAPLPERSDGHFVNSMQVTGFTEIGP